MPRPAHHVLVRNLPLCIGFCVAAAQASAQPATDATTGQLIEAGHYLRAEKNVHAELQHAPNDPHTLIYLSVVDWAFNRLDAAIASAERAVATAPNYAETHAHLADAVGSKLVASTAGMMERMSLAHRFRKEIDRTLELDPNNVDALQDLAQFYWHAPGIVGGDKQKARQTADRLFQLSPFRGASARADFAGDEADPSRRNAAVQAIWRSAVAARPNDYDCRAALAAAYLEDAGDPNHLAAAEADAQHALALDPSRISAYNTLAVVYARTGRWDQMDTLLKQGRDRVPDDRTPEFLVANAILSGNMGPQLQRAEVLLRDYLAQTPEGQEPSHASAHWRLGLVLEKQGRRSDAVRELQTAIAQDGSLEAARRDLKRLS